MALAASRVFIDINSFLDIWINRKYKLTLKSNIFFYMRWIKRLRSIKRKNKILIARPLPRGEYLFPTFSPTGHRWGQIPDTGTFPRLTDCIKIEICKAFSIDFEPSYIIYMTSYICYSSLTLGLKVWNELNSMRNIVLPGKMLSSCSIIHVIQYW
jgi:hypothetical protein